MPIQFSQSTPQGVTVDYNVVSQLIYDPAADQTSVQLQSYVDKTAYDNGAQPFPGQGFTFDGQLDLNGAELAIIALPAWSGATIVQ